MAHLLQPPNIIETTNISPPRGTVQSTTLPLTFFDAPWLTLPLGESLFFFSYQNSTQSFLKDFVPNLKHSLSITLQHFFPFAGKLVIPSPPEPPYLRYNDGEDFLVFTVAESMGASFEDLKTDSPKDVRVLHSLLPKLPPAYVSMEGIQVRPVMAMQVTIFSGAGICIGNTSTHVASDGVTFSQFMKYWMAVTKSNGTDSLLPSLPIHSCRNMIKDPGEVAKGHLERFWNQNSGSNGSHSVSENMVRATFTLSKNQIRNLKSWVTEKSENQKSPVSTFVVTLAFVWASLITTLLQDSETEEDKDEDFHLLINVDCRNRIKYTEPIPSTFFGNCMAPGIVTIKKRDLLGQNGILAASDAIAKRIKDMISSDLLKAAPTWGQEVRKWVMSRFPISIAGAPKLGLYDMDFGIGKPCKMEIVHIETGGSIAFSESRDGSNGVEIGIAIENKKMDSFTWILQQGIKNFEKSTFLIQELVMATK